MPLTPQKDPGVQRTSVALVLVCWDTAPTLCGDRTIEQGTASHKSLNPARATIIQLQRASVMSYVHTLSCLGGK